MHMPLVMPINMRQPVYLLLHGVMRVGGLFILNFPLLFISMLMVAVDHRVWNILVQDLRQY
jgi:hypothetical protein